MYKHVFASVYKCVCHRVQMRVNYMSFYTLYLMCTVYRQQDTTCKYMYVEYVFL